MTNNNRSQRLVKVCCMAALLFSTAFSASVQATPLEQGKQLFEKRCATCHALPDSSAFTWNQWIDIMVAMSHMAGLDDGERALILQYLLSTHIAYDGKHTPANKFLISTIPPVNKTGRP